MLGVLFLNIAIFVKCFINGGKHFFVLATTTSDQPSASGSNTEKGHPSCPSPSDQKLSVEGTCIETRDSMTAERKETVDEPEAG